jgi:hypothetical protein
LFFAIDFSELHDYIHFAERDARRAEINTYILNTLDDRFTILPGAVGELLSDLRRIVPQRLQPNYGEVLYTYPTVVQFLSGFPETIRDEARLIDLYGKAEADLKSTLGGILDVIVRGQAYTSVQALQHLLSEGKLSPIQGVNQIGSVSSEDKALSQLVRSYLSVSRPTLTESNEVDALDFVVALLLNKQEDSRDKRYITIYSQATSLIQACRSHDKLRWDNDYLIRELKYFQFRAKIQEMFTSTDQRNKQAAEWHHLCRELKAEIGNLINIEEQFHGGAIESPLKLADQYRRFDEECKQPLLLRTDTGQQLGSRERAQKLYEVLIDKSMFVGRVEEAYEVLKEHLRSVHKDLQAFVPLQTDTSSARAYKANLQRWLGLDV